MFPNRPLKKLQRQTNHLTVLFRYTFAINSLRGIVFYSAIIFLPIYFFFESNLLTSDRAEVFFQMFYQGIIVFIAVVLFSYSSL